jgi:hypothetical protein
VPTPLRSTTITSGSIRTISTVYVLSTETLLLARNKMTMSTYVQVLVPMATPSPVPFQTSTIYGPLSVATSVSTVLPSGTASGTYIVQYLLPTWPRSRSAILVRLNTVCSVNTTTDQISQLGPSINNVTGGAYINDIGYNAADNMCMGLRRYLLCIYSA